MWISKDDGNAMLPIPRPSSSSNDERSWDSASIFLYLRRSSETEGALTTDTYQHGGSNWPEGAGTNIWSHRPTDRSTYDSWDRGRLAILATLTRWRRSALMQIDTSTNRSQGTFIPQVRPSFRPSGYLASIKWQCSTNSSMLINLQSIYIKSIVCVSGIYCF